MLAHELLDFELNKYFKTIYNGCEFGKFHMEDILPPYQKFGIGKLDIYPFPKIINQHGSINISDDREVIEWNVLPPLHKD